MNKVLVTLLIVAMGTHVSNAQLLKSYGIKVAYTSANQTYTSDFSGSYRYDHRSGFNAAAFGEWLNTPFVSVVTQVEYAQRGMRTSILDHTVGVPMPLNYVTIDNRVDYLSMLPLLKLAVPLSVLRPYILAGPRFDFLLGYKSTPAKYGYGDAFENFKKSSYGASLGLGAELTNVLPVVVSIEGRYNADLVSASTYGNIRNDAFDIWVGVGF